MNAFCRAHARRRAKTYEIVVLKNFILKLERGPVALTHEFGKIAYVLQCPKFSVLHVREV